MRTRNGLNSGLVLAALGVVYGDIGTSPLYALRESFHASHLELTRLNVLGVLSLILWALIVVISIKYLLFILRADNRGEGGMLALSALVNPRPPTTRRLWFLLMLGLFGTALLYGDGMITPAISVLSAIEGLKIVTPVFDPYVQPITVAILIALFAAQNRGTAVVGRVFGPVMLVWFLTLAALGVRSILSEPTVLEAVNPIHAIRFFVHNGWVGYFVLGSVFLVVTGGEALYADLGHFGRGPIRAAWFSVVLPALVLNYFGQGAILLRDPSSIENPFFRLAPEWGLLPLVVLATCATVIASQALISGAFSITMQAVQLGYAPRVFIEHTSAHQRGQIYVPLVNWGLMLSCIGLVIGFGSSSNLAAAYGVGVTTDMVITTLLFYFVIYKRWKWKLPAALLFAVVYLFIDLAFWGANIVKVPNGGWFPLVVALLVFTLFATWRTGRQILAARLEQHSRPLQQFIEEIERIRPPRVPGTAVFMFRNLNAVPPALIQNLRHNKVLHERVVILCVQTAEVAHVPDSERLEIKRPADHLYTMQVTYGFTDEPNVPEALRLAANDGVPFDPESTTYFLGRENLIATRIPGMAIWRERLFAWMSRNARSAPMFFQIPHERAVELGTQIEL
ncbi:MAG TPA: potassium transporter Kup [Terriglobales bacterium]|nr:potassium transporter Kup [Terriglobales bacterium]